VALPSNDIPRRSGTGSTGTATASAFRPGSATAAGLGFALPARGEAIAVARRRVRAYLGGAGCDSDTVETVTLLVSELTTNAVRHTASPVFECRVHFDGVRVRLEVEDQGGTPVRPERREPRPGDVDGRGLLLVDALCARWGVAEAPRGGRIVSAEIVPHR
jgi:anti-sigma regulatory factor (Ser/Thr protein kinase)